MNILNGKGEIFDPSEYHLQASVAISLREVLASNIRIEDRVLQTFHELIAAAIVRMRIRYTDRDFSREYHADVYVFSPDEFWGIVEATATRLNARVPSAQP